MGSGRPAGIPDGSEGHGRRLSSCALRTAARRRLFRPSMASMFRGVGPDGVQGHDELAGDGGAVQFGSEQPQHVELAFAQVWALPGIEAVTSGTSGYVRTTAVGAVVRGRVPDRGPSRAVRAQGQGRQAPRRVLPRTWTV